MEKRRWIGAAWGVSSMGGAFQVPEAASILAEVASTCELVLLHGLGRGPGDWDGVRALRLAPECAPRAIVLTGSFFPPALNGRSLGDLAARARAHARRRA